MKACLTAAALLVLLAAPARAEGTCLEIGRIWSFHPLDRSTLLVEDELHRKFRVMLGGYCPRLPFKLALAIRSASGVNGLACVARGDTVVSTDAGEPFTCAVSGIVPYDSDTGSSDRTKSATPRND